MFRRRSSTRYAVAPSNDCRGCRTKLGHATFATLWTAVRLILEEGKPSPDQDRPRALPELHLLVRTPEQLEAALLSRPASITLDYLDLYGLRPSLDRVKSSGIAARVATPRVSKPGEERILNFLLSLECTIVVRSSGILHALQERQHPPLVGDFSLNTANSLTAAMYLGLGLFRITPTHDLNGAQIGELARRIRSRKYRGSSVSAPACFSHRTLCVLPLSIAGTSYRDCGRPCENAPSRAEGLLRPRPPGDCRRGMPQHCFWRRGAGSEWPSSTIGAPPGIRHFRLEFAHESAQQVREVVRAFDLTLEGSMTTQKLGLELRKLAPQGTTEGSLFVSNDYLKLPILQ